MLEFIRKIELVMNYLLIKIRVLELLILKYSLEVTFATFFLFPKIVLTMLFWWSNRQVSIDEGDAKSREFGIMFIETSAKAGFNIKVKD